MFQPNSLNAKTISATATAGAASASAAAGGARRHVLAFCVSIAAAATAQPAVEAVIRDGATGVGAIIWRGVLAAPVNGGDSIAMADLDIVGTTGNALTIEFTGATAAGVIGDVWLSYYEDPGNS